MGKFLLFLALANALISCAHDSPQQTSHYGMPISVSKPVVELNGEKVTDEAMANGEDIILVSASTGETVVLSFSYIMNQRKFDSDLRNGPLTPEECDNINVGAFAQSAKGTIWIVSFYAEKDGVRGDAEVVVFIRGENKEE